MKNIIVNFDIPGSYYERGFEEQVKWEVSDEIADLLTEELENGKALDRATIEKKYLTEDNKDLEDLNIALLEWGYEQQLEVIILPNDDCTIEESFPMFNEDVEEGRYNPNVENFKSCDFTACCAKGSYEDEEFDEDEDEEEEASLLELCSDDYRYWVSDNFNQEGCADRFGMDISDVWEDDRVDYTILAVNDKYEEGESANSPGVNRPSHEWVAREKLAYIRKNYEKDPDSVLHPSPNFDDIW